METAGEELQLPCQVTADGDLGRCGGWVVAVGMGRSWTQELLRMRMYQYTHVQTVPKVLMEGARRELRDQALMPWSGFHATALTWASQGSGPTSASFALGSLEQSFPLIQPQFPHL